MKFHNFITSPHSSVIFSISYTLLLCCDQRIFLEINPFSTNVPLTDKPGSWFLLTKCQKNTCGGVTFSVKMQVLNLHLYLKCHSPKHFSSKNQLPGFYVSGTLVENGFMKTFYWKIKIFDQDSNNEIKIRLFYPIWAFQP